MKAATKLSRKEIIQAVRSSMVANKVANAYLFGSYARNEAISTSDIDIAVDMKSGANLLHLVGFQQDLEEKLGLPVDITTRRAINARLKDSIEADLVAV